MSRLFCVSALAVAMSAAPASASDWNRFRGPNGTGIAAEADPPATWGDDENVLWKTPLPGPGSSSPVITPDGSKAFLTCYTGYGVADGAKSDLRSLVRHLLCFDTATGERLWIQSIKADAPREDAYRGFLTEHGYASNTPTTDGEHVFVFFGKSGVFAYTVDGSPVWDRPVGSGSATVEWGSAISPLLLDDRLFVTAFDESKSLVALDKATGEELWKTSLGVEGTSYGTPVLVDGGDAGPLLVMMLPNVVNAYDPSDGNVVWSVPTGMNRNVSDSPVAGELAGEPVVFVSGGFRGEESLMLRTAADLGDVDRVLWRSRDSASVSTPLFHEGRLFWLDSGGLAYGFDAASGERLFRARVADLVLGRHAVYASPVYAGGRVYLPTRQAGTIVLTPGDEYDELGRNVFAADDSDFNATPAVLGDTLLIRSNESLYRVGVN
ncbi:MAG: PQQ-binding-like beta-propeller repeat protein [Planctomycetota bacterium]